MPPLNQNKSCETSCPGGCSPFDIKADYGRGRGGFQKNALSLVKSRLACTRNTWLFVRLVITVPKMAQYTGKWLLTAP